MQPDTHIYFAGNNLTMDSEEGALVSAMAVARYAFNVDPLAIVLGSTGLLDSQAIVARVFYLAMYDIMFPGLDFNITDLAKSLLGLRSLLQQTPSRWWQSSRRQIDYVVSGSTNRAATIGLLVALRGNARMRALLARAQGDEAAYRDYRDRYRALAPSLGFKEYMKWAKLMP
jgi:hypothetical protein